MSAVELRIVKPRSIWRRPLKADVRELTRALSKGVVARAMGDFDGVREAAFDTATAIGLDLIDPGERAWVLIRNALGSAIVALLRERPLVNTDSIRDDLVDAIDTYLADHSWTIDTTWFASPETISLFADVKRLLVETLLSKNITELDAASIARALTQHFLQALLAEWRSRPQYYQPIEAVFQSPFRNAFAIDLEWRNYHLTLQQQVEAPVFDETFGLRDIYIPPRGIAWTRDEHRQFLPVVCDVQAELARWLGGAKRTDAVRILSGGPGSGKSSTAKLFAATVAAGERARVLFVPLYLFDFGTTLEQSISQFAQTYSGLSQSPLEASQAQPVVLVFDGLDELVMLGRYGTDVARQFLLELGKLLDRHNQRSVPSAEPARVVSLLTGREVLLQNLTAYVPQGGAIDLLPYLVTSPPVPAAMDPHRLLDTDQRDEWWRKYAALKGHGDTALPIRLKRPDLDELTSQPLLNYLIALSYYRGKLDFELAHTINNIYADLVSAVHERAWADTAHPSARTLVTEENFVAVLEEVALCTWHGNGRTTTASAVEERCSRDGLSYVFEKFEEAAQRSVVQLLTAFYFRYRAEKLHAERTFEFTHKSFGEYLAARRIVRSIAAIVERFDAERRRVRSEGCAEELLEWYDIAGPAVLDPDLLLVLQREIALQSPSVLHKWHTVLPQLLERVISHGLPLEAGQRHSFQTEIQQARNAEESLLAIVVATAVASNAVAELRHDDKADFGEWLARIAGPRMGRRGTIALDCLRFLNLTGVVLDDHDLAGANLSHSRLVDASLQRASLTGALCVGTLFVGAVLNGANLRDADLTRADFRGTSVNETSFQNAVLRKVSASGATMQRCDFRGADLISADFSGATLTECDLTSAQLQSALLRGARFVRCNLTRSDCSRGDFTAARFSGTTTVSAAFDGAVFHRTVAELNTFDGAELTLEQETQIIYPVTSVFVAQDPEKPTEPQGGTEADATNTPESAQ